MRQIFHSEEIASPIRLLAEDSSVFHDTRGNLGGLWHDHFASSFPERSTT